MKIGLLKEPENEHRVALLPEAVDMLVKLNVELIVEEGAGEKSFSSDADYKEAGASIQSKQEVIKNSDLLLKISPPSEEEQKMFTKGQVVVAVLNPLVNTNLIKDMENSKLTTFSLDTIPRITRAQSMDILSSMATVAGYKAVLEAANQLPGFFPMFMTAAGTIKPSKILILGAGVAGLQAIATARRLGGVVEAFDVRPAVKEEVESLGGKFIEVEGARHEESAGGYAVEQTEDYKQRQQQLVHDHAAKSDVIITTAQIPGKRAPVLVKRETVEAMKPGSVIVDLAASTGGNCELTQNDETVYHKGIRIIGNSNYPSQMPLDASRMFGKNVINFLKLIISEEGKMNLDFEDEIVKGTCITHDGNIINERIKEIINQ
ncbi:MAG: Re/Si-specific NAD(P)(+) transhydrogenase subunit alpha [Bacteroidales bacterium]|nr:Re/Si-specific NAD(P)(+) transhydrogenase subunit alpha [Bacteroidales bacterium]